MLILMHFKGSGHNRIKIFRALRVQLSQSPPTLKIMSTPLTRNQAVALLWPQIAVHFLTKINIYHIGLHAWSMKYFGNAKYPSTLLLVSKTQAPKAGAIES